MAVGEDLIISYRTGLVTFTPLVNNCSHVPWAYAYCPDALRRLIN